LQFPNTVAAVPEGERIVSLTDGSPPSTKRGLKTMPSVESMGFRLCLSDFLDELEMGKTSSPHRLTNCRATIRVIEEMEAAAKGA
jgi:hypothetical protein